MERHEYAEICRISITASPNQRCAAGCTAFVTHRSSAETIGHASVAAGATAAGPDAIANAGSRRPVMKTGFLSALAILYMLPAVIAFGFARRCFVQTFSGGVKA